jgi:hypothetical protein
VVLRRHHGDAGGPAVADDPAGDVLEHRDHLAGQVDVVRGGRVDLHRADEVAGQRGEDRQQVLDRRVGDDQPGRAEPLAGQYRDVVGELLQRQLEHPRGSAPRTGAGLARGQLGDARVLRRLLHRLFEAGEDPAGQHRAAGRVADRLGDRGQQAHVLGDEQQAGVGAELAGAERQRAGVPGGDGGRTGERRAR